MEDSLNPYADGAHLDYQAMEQALQSGTAPLLTVWGVMILWDMNYPGNRNMKTDRLFLHPLTEEQALATAERYDPIKAPAQGALEVTLHKQEQILFTGDWQRHIA